MAAQNTGIPNVDSPLQSTLQHQIKHHKNLSGGVAQRPSACQQPSNPLPAGRDAGLAKDDENDNHAAGTRPSPGPGLGTRITDRPSSSSSSSHGPGSPQPVSALLTFSTPPTIKSGSITPEPPSSYAPRSTSSTKSAYSSPQLPHLPSAATFTSFHD